MVDEGKVSFFFSFPIFRDSEIQWSFHKWFEVADS